MPAHSSDQEIIGYTDGLIQGAPLIGLHPCQGKSPHCLVGTDLRNTFLDLGTEQALLDDLMKMLSWADSRCPLP